MKQKIRLIKIRGLTKILRKMLKLKKKVPENFNSLKISNISRSNCIIVLELKKRTSTRLN